MAGRPTKYKPEYCDEVINYLGQGKSVTQFSAYLKVNKTTIYQWAKDYPEFSNALTRAQELSEAYWETELVEMMRDRDVNAPLVKLYFANRFNWSDKQAHDHTTKGDKINKIDLSALNDAELRTLAEMQRKSGIGEA